MAQTLSIVSDRSDFETRFLARSPRSVAGPCVSIYVPRSRPGFAPAQRKFMLIRLIKEAGRRIVSTHGSAAARRMLAELWSAEPFELLDRTSDSLAIFHDEEFSGAIHLPVDVARQVVVSDSFHIKPVISWLQSAPHYYLVSLSARKVSLFEATPWELRLATAVEAEPERQAGRSERRGARGASERERRSDRIRRFFSRAEEALHPIIGRDRHPVVLAGVSELHPVFRQVSRDPDLVEHAIHGNVERWSPLALRRSSLAIMAALLDEAKDRASAEYREAAWRGTATDDLDRIGHAASRGQVERLLIAEDVTVPGRFDARTGAIELLPGAGRGVDCVLDDLAEAVLSRGGKVLCMKSHELPTRSPAAAFLGF